MSEVESSPKSIKFRIPSIPPSCNDLYYHIKDHYARYQYVLKPEVRLWKTQAKEYVPPFAIDPGQLFYFNWVAVNNWRYDSGKPKRYDLFNLEKVLVDAVCEKLGIDDCCLWESYQRAKIHSPSKQYIEAEIGIIEAPLYPE